MGGKKKKCKKNKNKNSPASVTSAIFWLFNKVILKIYTTTTIFIYLEKHNFHKLN